MNPKITLLNNEKHDLEDILYMRNRMSKFEESLKAILSADPKILRKWAKLGPEKFNCNHCKEPLSKDDILPNGSISFWHRNECPKHKPVNKLRKEVERLTKENTELRSQTTNTKENEIHDDLDNYDWFHGKVDQEIIDNMVKLYKEGKIKLDVEQTTRQSKELNEIMPCEVSESIVVYECRTDNMCDMCKMRNGDQSAAYRIVERLKHGNQRHTK